LACNQDLYPDWDIDVALSVQDNVGLNEPIGNDAEGNGAPSAETLAPNLIGSISVGETHPSAIDQVVPTAPSGDGQKKKCIVLGTKCKHDKAVDDQVIIELPPYRGTRSPLDIVVVEHTFGHLFEAFRHISQAARTNILAGDDALPSKRARAPSLKKLLVPKYVTALLAYSVINLDPCFDITAIHKKPSMSGLLKPTTKLVTILKTATLVAATVISSSEEGTRQTVLSIADAWDSSRHVTNLIEGSKNWEANQESTPFVPLLVRSP
jgi:hypothetical protein